MKSGVERGTITVIGSLSSRAQKAAARPALPPVCVDGNSYVSWGVSKQSMFFCSPEELINFVHPLLAACREDRSGDQFEILAQWDSFSALRIKKLVSHTHTQAQCILQCKL